MEISPIRPMSRPGDWCCKSRRAGTEWHAWLVLAETYASRLAPGTNHSTHVSNEYGDFWIWIKTRWYAKKRVKIYLNVRLISMASARVWRLLIFAVCEMVPGIQYVAVVLLFNKNAKGRSQDPYARMWSQKHTTDVAYKHTLSPQKSALVCVLALRQRLDMKCVLRGAASTCWWYSQSSFPVGLMCACCAKCLFDQTFAQICHACGLCGLVDYFLGRCKLARRHHVNSLDDLIDCYHNCVGGHGRWFLCRIPLQCLV